MNLKNMPQIKNEGKYQLKTKTKPWTTAATYKLIFVKSSFFKKYIKLKFPVKKNNYNQES